MHYPALFFEWSRSPGNAIWYIRRRRLRLPLRHHNPFPLKLNQPAGEIRTLWVRHPESYQKLPCFSIALLASCRFHQPNTRPRSNRDKLHAATTSNGQFTDRMNRVFGKKKAPGPPPPSLGDASSGVGNQIEGMDGELLNCQLLHYTFPPNCHNRLFSNFA